MLILAILMMGIMFMFVPWVDRMQKRRKQEWQGRRKRFMAIGKDDPSSSPDENRP